MDILRAHEITSAWFDAIAANADLAAWCVSHGGEPYIWQGINERKRPLLSQSPGIIIVPDEMEIGIDNERMSYGVGLTVFMDVADGGETITGRTTEYTANEDVEIFAHKVLNIINATAYQPHEVSGVIDYTEYPVVQYQIRITVNVPRTMGGGITWKED